VIAADRESASACGAVERVLVAMSGGVDSSVAAALLAESGVETIGVTMTLRERFALLFSRRRG
jgi:tRNA-specific 2-thiouridylase